MSVDLENFAWFKAGVLARERWPEITQKTEIYIATTSMVIMPVVQEVPLTFERIGDMAFNFGREEIIPDRVKGLAPIVKIGYGPRTDTLVIVLDVE